MRIVIEFNEQFKDNDLLNGDHLYNAIQVTSLKFNVLADCIENPFFGKTHLTVNDDNGNPIATIKAEGFDQ